MGFLVIDVASTIKFLTKVSETGYGFFLRGCFSRALKFLGMLLIFVFCMKILRFNWHSKGLMRFLCELGAKPRNALCFRNGVVKVCSSKITRFNKNDSTSGKENVSNSNGDAEMNSDLMEERDDSEREAHNEDEVFDVMTLRKLVKIERQRANAAYAELEKERTASASAAEETMAMILRLQSEKSSAEIEANQFRRMAEKKQQHDQEVIDSLRWIIMQNESHIRSLEDKLNLYREKLRQYMREDEMEQFEELDDDDVNRNFSSFSVDDI